MSVSVSVSVCVCVCQCQCVCSNIDLDAEHIGNWVNKQTIYRLCFRLFEFTYIHFHTEKY